MKKSLNEYDNSTFFLSRISHELFTPLNAIINMSYIAESADDLPKMKECVLMIRDTSTQMLGIINDILDISRLELGRVSLANLPFELEKALMGACRLAMPVASEKKQQLEFDIEEGVPTKLRGDESRLAQLIAILLKSAVSISADNEEIKVLTRCPKVACGKAALEFCIMCAGNGVPYENWEQMSNVFKQLNEKEYLNQGETELGFIICKKICEMMGGSIFIEYAAGAGGSFNFTVQMDVFEADDARVYTQRFENKQGVGPVCTECGGCSEGAVVLSAEYEKYLPFIDVEKGLSTTGGNKKMFAAMLKGFREGSVVADFMRSMKENDKAGAMRNYNTLRCVARNLSLLKLDKTIVKFEGQRLNKVMNPLETVLPGIDELAAETNQKIDELLAEWEQGGGK